MAELNDYDKLACIFSVAEFKGLTSLLQNNSSNLNYVSRDKVSLEKLSILTDVQEELSEIKLQLVNNEKILLFIIALLFELLVTI